MTDTTLTRIPLLLWPFTLIWRAATLVVSLAGRLVCAVLGVVLVAVGATATLTVVGAPLGIPLGILGVLLLARSIF